MTYQLEFNVEPIAWARARVGKFGHFTAPRQRAAKEKLQILMRAMWRSKPLEKPLRVEIVFFIAKPKGAKRAFPSVKPDADNFAKLVMDCGNEILWTDDALIVDLHVRKEYGTPSIKLRVGEI